MPLPSIAFGIMREFRCGSPFDTADEPCAPVPLLRSRVLRISVLPKVVELDLMLLSRRIESASVSSQSSAPSAMFARSKIAFDPRRNRAGGETITPSQRAVGWRLVSRTGADGVPRMHAARAGDLHAEARRSARPRRGRSRCRRSC